MQAVKTLPPPVPETEFARPVATRTDTHLLLRRINEERWLKIRDAYPRKLFANVFYWAYGEDPLQTGRTIRKHLESARKAMKDPPITITMIRIPWVQFSLSNPEPETIIQVVSTRIGYCSIRMGGPGSPQYALLLKADLGGGDILSPYDIALSEIPEAERPNYPQIP